MSDDQGNPGGALSIYMLQTLMAMNGEIVDNIVQNVNTILDGMDLNQNPTLEGRKGIPFGT